MENSSMSWSGSGMERLIESDIVGMVESHGDDETMSGRNGRVLRDSETDMVN